MTVLDVRPAPVAVALDTADLPQAVRWASAVGPYVSTCKVGLELFLRHGASAVLAVANAAGRPVFLDLKLHDIPTTVAGAARSVAELEPAYVTVHASGGAAMVRAAVDELPSTTLVTGVTVLTSLDAGCAVRGRLRRRPAGRRPSPRRPRRRRRGAGAGVLAAGGRCGPGRGRDPAWCW